MNEAHEGGNGFLAAQGDAAEALEPLDKLVCVEWCNQQGA